MKILAMYLPQFHETKENNEWWGEGFTEWTAAQKAKPLFEGHMQPKRPLDGNYYNLLNKETMIWQAGLMKKYGVDGLCFYHYYFKDGRKILEKPAENLLRWADIDMPFCFCWANESWARSWSNVRNKNVWANTFEDHDAGIKNDKKGMLLEQKYGDEDAWREHYLYLRPFFKDVRYIKVDNQPIIMIYQTAQIYCLKDMLDCFRSWAIEDGFSGIYVIGTNNDRKTADIVDAVLIHEPQAELERVLEKKNANGITCYDYDEIWKSLLEYETRGGKKTYYGGFVDYDDTPRRAGDGLLITGGNPVKFGKYLSELIAKNQACDNEFVFINAWNEWGEGMYLEPDEENQYSYLEKINEAKENYTEYLPKYNGFSGICSKTEWESKKDIEEQLKNAVVRSERRARFMQILDKWLCLKEDGKSISEFLETQGYKTAAVYGMGMLGHHLIRELEEGNITISYGIDKNAANIHDTFPIYHPDGNLGYTDIVIITVIDDSDRIQKLLSEKKKKSILLENLIMEM